MNTPMKKYYHFTGVVPENCDVHPFFEMTDEEVSRIRELTVEAYKAYIGPDYDDNWASTFEEVCEDCELWRLQGFNAELDKLLFDSFDDCDGYPFTIFSIDLQHPFIEEEKTFGLKPLSELTEKFDIDETDVDEGDKLKLTEVCRQGGFVLYEHEDEDVGVSISDDTIHKLFPEFEIDHQKHYIIEKNGEIYYE